MPHQSIPRSTQEQIAASSDSSDFAVSTSSTPTAGLTGEASGGSAAASKWLDRPRAQNEHPQRELATLAKYVLLSCADIDAATVAESPSLDTPPGWWLAMRELENAARKAQAALGSIA